MSGTSIGNATSIAAGSLQPTDVIPVERPGVTTPYKTKVSSLSLAVTGMINVKDYGAVGDGTTDDTAAIQAAIDAANALYSATVRNVTNVFFPYAAAGYLVSSITLKSGVNLYAPSSANRVGSYLTSTTAGFVIDTAAGETWDAGVDGLSVKGGGTAATNNMGGIRFQDGTACWIKNVFLQGFANQAVLVSDGIACIFKNILIYNTLMDRSRSAVAGAFEIYGTDHLVDWVEAGTSQQSDLTSITDANLYCTGMLIGCSTSFIRDCVAEYSDVGMYIAGDYNRYVSVRADHNYAHGWMIAAASSVSQFSNCFSMNNSLAADNTYDGFHVVGTAGNNHQFSNCLAFCNTAQTTKHRYGYYDGTTSGAGANRYVGCVSVSHVTGIVYLSGNASSIFELPTSGGKQNFTDGDTTPSVAGKCNFNLANTGATTITDFDDGIDGQIIRVMGDANTTITHGTNIYAAAGSNITTAVTIMYSFQKRGTKWYQI